MSIDSYTFIFVFLPITLLGYYSIRRFGYQRLSMAWLVVASVVFYGWFNPVYLGLILGSVVFNYVLGGTISKRAGAGPPKAGALLALAIAVNLVLLGYFKYANFFVDNMNAILASDFNLQRIILPLAISFFTMQQIAYLVDSYRGQIAEHDLLKYSLLVTFFPKLLAGPIVRYNEMFPQEAKDRNTWCKRDDIVIGLSILFIGLFKKVVLADGVAPYADDVFNLAAANAAPPLINAWIGALGYTLQLYFDFSAYSDMAIGMGLMLGFRMPLNFWSPYKAVDVTDFWRRWHITLSRFLRDYVYIPLGGNRKGSLRRNVNLMVTMLVAGIWHGAGWTFVIWGLMHGLYLVMSHMWRALQQSLHWDMDRSPRLLIVMSVLTTFVAVAVAWVFFRAESVEAAVVMIKGMVGLNGVVGSGWYIDRIGLIWICLLLVICWFAPNSQEFMANYRTTFDAFGGRPVTTRNRWLRWSSTPVGATIVAGMTALAILGMSKASPFIYFQF